MLIVDYDPRVLATPGIPPAPDVETCPLALGCPPQAQEAQEGEGGIAQEEGIAEAAKQAKASSKEDIVPWVSCLSPACLKFLPGAAHAPMPYAAPMPCPPAAGLSAPQSRDTPRHMLAPHADMPSVAMPSCSVMPLSNAMPLRNCWLSAPAEPTTLLVSHAATLPLHYHCEALRHHIAVPSRHRIYLR